MNLPINGAEVVEVLKQLRGSRNPGVSEIHSELSYDSGCCEALLVDMPLQNCKEVRDGMFGLAHWD